MVPRHSRETRKPLRPNVTCFIAHIPFYLEAKLPRSGLRFLSSGPEFPGKLHLVTIAMVGHHDPILRPLISSDPRKMQGYPEARAQDSLFNHKGTLLNTLWIWR
jgi:hypothetical protein